MTISVIVRCGLHGGSVLARDAAAITLYDVVTAIAPLPRITTCPLALPSHGKNLCAVHRKLDDAVAMVEEAFRSSSIADLRADATPSVPLIDLPVNPAAATRAAETAFPVERTTSLTVRGRRPARAKRR